MNVYVVSETNPQSMRVDFSRKELLDFIFDGPGPIFSTFEKAEKWCLERLREEIEISNEDLEEKLEHVPQVLWDTAGGQWNYLHEDLDLAFTIHKVEVDEQK